MRNNIRIGAQIVCMETAMTVTITDIYVDMILVPGEVRVKYDYDDNGTHGTMNLTDLLKHIEDGELMVTGKE